MFALSHMQLGTAGEWRNLKLQDLADGAWEIPSWIDFETLLWTDFGNVNRQSQAQRDIDNFYQRSLPAGEFFIKFDRLRILAGFHEDASLIALLRRLLRPNLLAEILPTTR
ncbi:hypothetical protein NLJ89_g12411 [Agrocybe chaxingu]|uniref:Uncharacterized protein n=1 Tax=Agrocybe chaxingu TaxID=84603 RepID=A0A9W8JND2_9AGAR|nr:hypothetical protein NLJ89_g12411 [Agrocybe chaxingu]